MAGFPTWRRVAMPFNNGLKHGGGPLGSPAMNHLFRLLAVGALLTAVQSFAADAFEGKVTFAMSGGKDRTQVMDYTMKGSLLRMDINAEGHAASTIMDMGKREMLMLMHAEHMYMVMPMKLPPEAATKAKAMESTAEIEKTGKTETILGYKCQQVLVKDKGVTTEMWLAEGLGTFMGMGGGGGSPFGGGGGGGAAPGKWEQALKGLGGFPLRVISHNASNKETFKMEVTKIAPGPQPDSEFTPPADYQKFQMPGGMNPFGG